MNIDEVTNKIANDKNIISKIESTKGGLLLRINTPLVEQYVKDFIRQESLRQGLEVQ
jgi:hypothetical protein